MVGQKSNSVELPQLSSDELLPPISRWNKICGLSFVVVFVTAVIFSIFFRYPVKVHGAAVVRPDGEVNSAQATVEGTVKKIHVKDNQPIQMGDAIVTLDSSHLESKKSQLLTTLKNSQMQLDQLLAQLGKLATQRLSETQVIEHTVSAMKAEQGRAKREYEDRQSVTQVEVSEAQGEYQFAQKTYDRYAYLASEGAISQQQVDEKRQALNAAQAKLERAQASLNPSNALVSIATESVSKEAAKGASMLAVLDKERETLLQRQTELQNQLERDRKELKQIEAEILKYVVRSPVSGVIFKVEARNDGQVIRPAETIAQIVPGNVPLVIKAQVAAQDISKVRRYQDKEQEVNLRFSTFPYPNYGIMRGRVLAKSPDAIPSVGATQTSQSKINQTSPTYFEVIIQPDKPYVGNPSNKIEAGMEVSVEIIVQDETVMTFLLRKARLLTDL
jgi:multidrug efflux pump subunit AcrA (membrane-fusion protein)